MTPGFDLSAEARRVAGLPDDWHAWIFESAPQGTLCTGAVCPPITRGKNKGEPNYGKADPSTKCTVLIPRSDSFQDRSHDWLSHVLGEDELVNVRSRGFRFVEEALELAQAVAVTADEAKQLVDYVWGRPVGETEQEVGGVLLTLHTLCSAVGIRVDDAGEKELANAWRKIDKIRKKHQTAGKGPLPGNAD